MIDTTEELVRVGLEEREKKRVSEYIEAHPGLEGEMSALHLEFDASIRKSLRQTGLAMIEDEKKEIDGQIDGLLQSSFPYFKVPRMVLEEKKEKLNEEAKNLDKDVDEAVKGPPFGQFAGFFSLDTIRTSAGQGYRANFQKKFEEALAHTLPESMEDSERKKVVDTTKALADYSRLNDALVLRLAGIASEKGIEYAMREKTIAEVKKEMFPTPELYRKHRETGKGLMANGMYAAFDFSGEQPAKTNETIMRTSFKKGIEAYVGVATRIQDGIEEQEIKEIYGAKSQQQLEDEEEQMLEAAIAANRNKSIKYSPMMSGRGHRR